jgi:hypothetical protein
MTSEAQNGDSPLTNDELAVAAAIEAIAKATSGSAVHRTTLLAIIEAAREQPALVDSDAIMRLDRELVSDALLMLRDRRWAVLDDAGFRLTPTGEDQLEALESEGLAEKLGKELQRLVGSKLSEWALA